jgi:peptidoglycan/LPS O-acetylase OafA/YrhL
MAVLGVMGSHFFRGSVANAGFLVRSIGSAFAFGARGVDLFFVLSGFLITGILYDSLSDSGYFRKFYARRCLRIFPLYYGVLFALLLLTPWLHIQWQNMQWSLLLYLQNTNVIMPIYQWQSHSVDLIHFWTLAVEEQFYLVWPLAVSYFAIAKKSSWPASFCPCPHLFCAPFWPFITPSTSSSIAPPHAERILCSSEARLHLFCADDCMISSCVTPVRSFLGQSW